MRFKFIGEDIRNAIELKIKKLEDKSDEIDNITKKYTSKESYKKINKKARKICINEYNELPTLKKIFTNKEGYIEYCMQRLRLGDSSYNAIVFNYYQEFDEVQSEIAELRYKYHLFEKDREYRLDIDECREYGLSEYMKKKE